MPLASAAAPGQTPTFRFDREAGRTLLAMWDESVKTQQERVACLAATARNDTVFVHRVRPLEPVEADSLGTSAELSIADCGPPAWSGTVHTHVAEYRNGRPSSRFSAQDRGVMRMWYERWRTDGVFCVVHGPEQARCEADGVVGGMRSVPRLAP